MRKNSERSVERRTTALATTSLVLRSTLEVLDFTFLSVLSDLPIVKKGEGDEGMKVEMNESKRPKISGVKK